MNNDLRSSRVVLAEDSGKLLLRVTLGALMLLHGFAKWTGDGLETIATYLTDAGLPAVFAYGVYIGEVLAPLLMILGVLTRWASFVFAFNMLVAIVIGHPGELLQLNQYGGWMIELPVLYLVGALAVGMLGPGRYAIYRGNGIWQ